MYKVIAGFFFGVTATLTVVYWLDENAPEVRPGQTGHSLHPEEPAEARPASTANGIDSTVVENRGDSVVSSSFEAVSSELPSAMQTRSAEAPQQSGSSVNLGRRLSATTVDDQYPPEIAEMIENRVDKELQARYENDEREDSWATYMEGQLAAYFAQKPSLAQFYVSLIDCRTSVCSIHVLGYGPDALTQWNTATADLVSQQWFEFNNLSMNRRNPEPDILAVVLILTKKPAG